MPKRIQRQRTLGWRMPANAIYVGRPTTWGNPFPVWKYGTATSLEYFRAFCLGEVVWISPATRTCCWNWRTLRRHPVPNAKTTTFHLCQSITGPLANWGKREFKQATEWIRKSDGSKYTADEVRAAFVDELTQGHEVIPIGEPCEGFSYKTGCPGHPKVPDAV